MMPPMMILLATLLATSGYAEDCETFQRPQLNQALDLRTRSRARTGNAAQLLSNGDAAFKRRLESAEEAELIFVKTFIYADDETGRAIAEVLARRARAGATVILQYDIKGSLGSLGSLSEHRENIDKGTYLSDPPLMTSLREAGVMVVPTNVPRTQRAVRRFVEAREDLERVACEIAGAARATSSWIWQF